VVVVEVVNDGAVRCVLVVKAFAATRRRADMPKPSLIINLCEGGCVTYEMMDTVITDDDWQ